MSVKNLTFINNCGTLTEKILEFVGKICIYQKKAVNLQAVLLLTKKYIIMKKFYSFCIMLAVVLGAVSFVACDKENQNDPSPKAELQKGQWVCQVNESHYMFFEFEKSSFKFHEVGVVLGEPVDAWAGGAYVIKGNDLNLSFTDCNVPEMKSKLGQMETHAVLDGNTIHYSGYDFVLQK